MRFFLFAGTTLAAVLAFVSNASANAGGLPGYSGKPNTAHPTGESCMQCHSQGGTGKPTVTFTGPASLTYGQTASYSLVVATGSPLAAGAIAATDGVTLTPTAGVRETFGELVPNGGVAPSGGKATFSFTVKAPTTGSAIKLWASGMASNKAMGDQGDYAVQITMDIALPGTTADAGTDSGSDAGSSSGSSSGTSGSSGESSSGSSGASSSGSSGGSSGSTSGGTEEDGGSSSSSGGATLPGDEAGGCNVSGTGDYGSALFLGALGMIPLLARRRRAKK